MGAFSLGLSAKLVMRFGIRQPLAVGLVLAAVGLLLFARAPVDGNFVVDVLPEHDPARLRRRHGVQPGAAGRHERRRAEEAGPGLGRRQHLLHDGRRARAWRCWRAWPRRAPTACARRGERTLVALDRRLPRRALDRRAVRARRRRRRRRAPALRAGAGGRARRYPQPSTTSSPEAASSLVGMRPRLAVTSVAAVVAAASADSSIVALALPQLYDRFHTTVVGVSWVLTSYNAVVAAAALALLVAGVSLRGLRPYVLGVGLFLASSAACAFATRPDVLDRGPLRAGARSGARPGELDRRCSVRVTGSASRSITVWTLAAGIGVAAGPALGGVLTELFDWRAIFLVQVPVAAFGLLAWRGSRSRRRRADGRPADEGRAARRRRDRAALRGAGRGAVPLRAAADPGLGLLADSRRGDRQRTAASRACWPADSRGGLPTRSRRSQARRCSRSAWSPSHSCRASARSCRCARSRSAARASGSRCRCCRGARSRVPTSRAARCAPSARAISGWSRRSPSSRRSCRTACRPPHITPSCRRPRSSSTRRLACRRRSPSHSISAAPSRMRRRATCPICAPRSTRTARGSDRGACARARQPARHRRADRRGRVPLLVRPLRGVRRRGVCDRGVRPPAAGLMRAVAALVVRRARADRRRGACCWPRRRPCASSGRARARLFSGHGVDAATQRVVLDGLARAGCSLGVTREALVLSFASPSGDQLKRRASPSSARSARGLGDALTAATKRGEIPALLAVILRLTIEHAPIDQLISGSLSPHALVEDHLVDVDRRPLATHVLRVPRRPSTRTAPRRP